MKYVRMNVIGRPSGVVIRRSIYQGLGTIAQILGMCQFDLIGIGGIREHLEYIMVII